MNAVEKVNSTTAYEKTLNEDEESDISRWSRPMIVQIGDLQV